MSDTQSWTPERFFYSHASCDQQLALLVETALRKGKYPVDVYLAEHGLVGKPLVEKLRSERLNCNAVLVGWSPAAAGRQETREIISFELGMAFSVGLPIYMLRVDHAEMPWFFDKLTDYAEIQQLTLESVNAALARIEPLSYYHPVELAFPHSTRRGSRNAEVVAADGAMVLPLGFDDIVYFVVENRRHRPEHDVRISLSFPTGVDVSFNAGSRDGRSGVQRNEVFEMWQASAGVVRMWWPSMPAEDGYAFELRLRVRADQAPRDAGISCSVSSENLVGSRFKSLPLRIVSATPAPL